MGEYLRLSDISVEFSGWMSFGELLSFGMFLLWDVLGYLWRGVDWVYLVKDKRVLFGSSSWVSGLVLVWVWSNTIKGIKALYWCLCLLFGLLFWDRVINQAGVQDCLTDLQH